MCIMTPAGPNPLPLTISRKMDAPYQGVEAASGATDGNGKPFIPNLPISVRMTRNVS